MECAHVRERGCLWERNGVCVEQTELLVLNRERERVWVLATQSYNKRESIRHLGSATTRERERESYLTFVGFSP